MVDDERHIMQPGEVYVVEVPVELAVLEKEHVLLESVDSRISDVFHTEYVVKSLLPHWSTSCIIKSESIPQTHGEVLSVSVPTSHPGIPRHLD